MASVLDMAVKRVTVETTWLPPIVINDPFKSQPPKPGEVSVTAMMKPRVTVESDYSDPIVIQPYGAPQQNWPYLKLILMLGGVGAALFVAKRFIPKRT